MFQMMLTEFLNLLNKIQAKIKNVDKKNLQKQLNFKDEKVPVQKKPM